MAEWDPDSRLNDLNDELALDGGNQVKAAERIFKENLVLAAQSICHTAVYSVNDRIRLDAAKYVVERNMGKVGDTDTQEDPFEELLRGIVKESNSSGGII